MKQEIQARNPFIAFRLGEEDGLDYFFKLLYKPLCFFARRYVSDMQAAEDIVTDGFLRVWEKRATITNAAGLKSYLYKVVYNGCMTWLGDEKRRKGKHAKSDLQLKTEENLYVSNIIRAETFKELHTGMAGLPAECRKVFTKLYIEGKTVRETAEELQLAISTVKAQKARGLKLLRLRFGDLLLVTGYWMLVNG